MVLRFDNLTPEEKNMLFALGEKYPDDIIVDEVLNAFSGDECIKLIIGAMEIAVLIGKVIEQWGKMRKPPNKDNKEDFGEIKGALYRPDGSRCFVEATGVPSKDMKNIINSLFAGSCK